MKESNLSPLQSSQSYRSIKDDLSPVFLPLANSWHSWTDEKYHMGYTGTRSSRQLTQEGSSNRFPEVKYCQPDHTERCAGNFEMRIILETSSVRLASTRVLNWKFRHLLKRRILPIQKKTIQANHDFGT